VSDFAINPEHLIGLRDALHRAAVAVRELDESRRFDVETKGDNTPLTTADLAANRILREALYNIDPDAAWLSEENEDDPERRLNHERVWIVDPIDGTREFVDGTGEYSVSAGLAINGAADLGGVALPRENTVIVGARGLGLRVWRYDAAGKFETIPGELSGGDSALPPRTRRRCGGPAFS
jgi:3'-phosphoadenosine 5'-phosphosulfate (PAPS) 3'-phosphatase